MKIDVKGVIIPSEDAWIYNLFRIENTSPKDVNKAIEEAGGERIDIYINSTGGDIFAGSEIYSAISGYEGEVKIHVVGMAASAASVIACAGKSEISPTAMIMVHNVSSGAKGDYHAMDKESEILKKANETIANAYVTKSGMTLNEALEMMDKETWLSAEDAVSKGLIDNIAQNRNLQLTASLNSGLLPQSVIDKMNELRIEDGLKNKSHLKNKIQAKLNLLKLGGIKID